VAATATRTATPPSGGTPQPALLAQYEVRGPLPEARNTAYRPRQFAAGAVIADATWGGQTVGSPGPYAGWDVLPTPNEGIMRIADRDDWLALRLTRPAALAIVWRGGDAVPGWLDGWARGADVVVNGGAERTYTRQVAAGEVTLGGVYNPGAVPGPHATLDTYWVLVGEASGLPSPAPAVPPGQPVPQPNQTCPSWVHDRYSAAGPDGRQYASWHPQIDPVYWCYFRHEHGSDPALLGASYRPLFGYASTAAGIDEPHTGFKSYAFGDGQGRRWLVTHHFGTGSVNRACTRFHELQVAAASESSGEVLADVHLLADFGKSVANTTGEPLTPAACRDQAAQAGGSTGARLLPVLTRQALAYEPWRMDGAGTVAGLTGAFTLNTVDAVVICNDVACDRDVVTGSTGTQRFFTYTRDLGINASAAAGGGTYYTDAYGRVVVGPGQSGALRQYVKPGLAIGLPYYGDNQTCHTNEPWQAWYTCDASLSQGLSIMLENAIQAPN
jgi:hypothetical protein